MRAYTSGHVNPILTRMQETSDSFIPAQVPAFSAMTVFSNFPAQPDYEGFVYKEATVNPSNPSNLADDFEAALWRRFKKTG